MFAPIFNFYDFLVLMTTGLSLFLVLPLLLKQERDKSDLLLCGFILSQGLLALNNVLMFNATLGPNYFGLLTPFHLVPGTILTAVQGFFLLGFSLTLTQGNIKAYFKISVVVAMVFMISVVEQVYVFSQPIEGHPHTFGTKILQILSCYLGVVAILRLREYNQRIQQVFSNIDHIRLRWLSICAAGFVGVWLIWPICFVLGVLGYKQAAIALGTFGNLPPLFMMSTMVIFSQSLYHYSLKNNHSGNALEELDTDPEEKTKTYNTEHCAQIVDLMTRVKIYQDPELRLEGLADSVGVSPRTASAILNGHFKKTFYDFVNEYRVRDAQDQLLSVHNGKKSVQRIFEDAGFSSKTTFNTIFKKYTGKTPTEFRQSVRTEYS